MNCTEFENIYNDLSIHITTSSQVFWIITTVVTSFVSLIMLLAGERFIRPTTAIIACLFGIGLGFSIAIQMQDVACEIRLGITVLSGIIFAILGACLLRTGFFILGAVSFGTIAHFIYEALPNDDFPKLFMFQSRSGLYWIVVIGSGITGSIISYMMRKDFLRIATSIVGGSGIAFSTYMFTANILEPPIKINPTILLIIMLITSGMGIIVQYYHSKKKKKAQIKKSESSD